jgi:glycosyltransferase involved in cell wall biosynthesis
LYASFGDGVGFAEALGKLADDEARRQDLGRRGRERAKTELSWDRAAECLIEIYQGLLADSRRR